MRNPVRLKNLQLRFLPVYVVGASALWLSRPSALGLALGLPLVLAGAALRGWAAGYLVKTDEFCVSGPYAHLRHPLYCGTLLIGVGFSLLLSGVWSVVLLAVLLPWFFLSYFPRKERSESARLERLYGESFSRYHAQVPALLPALLSALPSSWEGWRRVKAGGQRAQPEPAWRRENFLDNNELGTWLALLAGTALVLLRAVYPS